MKIAIIGATSQIAKDLIISFHENTDYDCFLFSRNTKKVTKNLFNRLENFRYKNLLYDSFSNEEEFDLILNFVSIVNPVPHKISGSEVFKVSESFDNMILNYLLKYPKTKYIFLSSGAVYGDIFHKPASKSSLSKFNINSFQYKDYYSISKFYLEAKHRSFETFSIVDLRVFNYFSSTQDLNANFFIIDVVNALMNKKTLATSSENIMRDYITPSDFFSLIQKIISFGELNIALDCYSKAPTKKFDLLAILERDFGLAYNVFDNESKKNVKDLKMNYFSKNKLAETIGYYPEYSSIEGILKELNVLFLSKV
jgi:nucleoside-diphosphate-sugar epimerase